MSTPAPASESSSVRTAYAFLRPLPNVREEDSPPAEVRPISSRDRWDRLFPSTAGIPDAGSSLDVAGLQLGQYLIQERIGRGGMGAVFRAVDLRLERIVALKVLAPEFTRDPGSVQRFQNEARAAAKLDHENIARVYASGEDGGQQFIAFEFVTGTNVRDMIQQRRMLTSGETVKYLLQMADALRHTSVAGVVHRDIKPSNIIITPAGRAKLVDLGLARHQTQNDLTVYGTTLGTFDYISPEQALDPRNVDVRSDLYSLGCTAYHMLTGEPPYNRGSMFQKVLDHHQNDVPDAAVKNPLVPQALSHIVRKLMASQPDHRYQRPEDLIRDLLPLAAALGVPADGGLWSELPPVRFSWAEHRGWILAMAILAILGVIASMPPRDVSVLPSTQATAITPSPAVNGLPIASNAKDTSDERASDAANSAQSISVQSILSGFTEGAASWKQGLDVSRQLGDLSAKKSDSSSSSVVRTTETATPNPSRPTAAGSSSNEENLFWTIGSSTEPNGGVAKPYKTLEAACLEAPDNSTIELRFDGESPALRPVRIEGKTLRIRAQVGRRPTLRFDVSGPVGQSVPSSMISLANGSLEIIDTDLVFHVPRGRAADRWSVFSLEQARRLSLSGVSVTLENSAQQQPASIIEFKSPTRPFMDRIMPDGVMRAQADIVLSYSILRGEADGLRMTELSEISIDMKHTAWALQGSLLAIDNGNNTQMATSVEPPPCRLKMDHVTTLVDGSLVTVKASEVGVAPTVDIRCDNSLIIVLRDNQPMVRMSGPMEMEEWQDRLIWKGTANYIEAVGPWWQISAERSLSTPLKNWNASDWSQHWNSSGNTHFVDRNVFEMVDAWDAPKFHEVSLPMFRLLPSNENYRAPEAADGSDAGVDWRFPQLPGKLPKP